MNRNVPGLMLAMVGLAAVCVLPTACDDSSGSSSVGDGGSDALNGGGANNGGGATNGGGGVTGGGGISGGGSSGALMSCATGVAQCSDGVDNDKDGKVDMMDGECVAPCDNDEASFATGISGDNIDACKQDCFFDGNSGQGDDGCEWNLKCDSKNPGGTSCPYNADYKNCPKAQSDKCIRNCRTVTPNGCDCFGCCAFPVDNKTATVMLVSTCTKDKLGDPKACPPCTQQTACVNTCEKCEVCIGKPQLEAECTSTLPPPDGGAPVTPDGGTPPPPPAPTPKCDPGIISCGPGGQVADGACAGNSYCLTGCCIFPVL